MRMRGAETPGTLLGLALQSGWPAKGSLNRSPAAGWRRACVAEGAAGARGSRPWSELALRLGLNLAPVPVARTYPWPERDSL